MSNKAPNQPDFDDYEKRLGVLENAFQRGGAVTTEVKKYPVRKIGQILYKSFRIGTLHLILSIFFFTTAMALIAMEVNEKRNSNQDIKEENQLFIEEDQEARRNNPKYGILAAILAPYNRYRRDYITDTKAERILGYFNKRVMGHTHSRILSAEKLPIEIKDLKLKEEEEADNAVTYNRKPPIIFKYRIPDFPGEECTVLIPPSEYSCDFETFSEILKSSQKRNKDYDYDYVLERLNRDQTCILDNTWESLKAALIISQADLGDTLFNDFQQIFFVSFDGIFSHRVKDPKLDQLLDIAEESPMYRWEASSYAQVFIENANDRRQHYTSKAYLDIAGLGIVETLSIPVHNKQGRVIGVICLDKQISIENYIKYLRDPASQNAVKSEAQFTKDYEKNNWMQWNYGAFDYKLFRLRHQGGSESDLAGKGEIEEEILNDIEKYYDKRELEEEYTKVKDDTKDAGGKIFFRIVLNRGKEYDHLLYISSSDLTLLEEIGPLLIIGILLILLSFILLFYAARKVTANNEKAVLANIIRNLPVGVLELKSQSNQDGFIKYGNDYAEEITGKVLTRFGEEEKKESITFQSLIDIDTILEPEHTLPGDPLRFRKSSYEEIEQKRNLEGRTTTYFARLKKEINDHTPERWVEVTGSPILNAHSDSVPTFGVFKQVVDQQFIKRLEKTLQISAGSQSNDKKPTR